ncbi:hypothetical protein CC2G_004343 [Coprinopsis cinerea AmutBmut pab1-1]|nr:hypothetical protein CC2G_004343 [Coprinopsis cinerea AmutBmut pab1-1]
MFTAFIAIVTTNIVRISTGISLSSRAQIQLSLRLSTVAIVLTVALNATATALIAYKLIRAQRTFASTLPGRSTSVYQSAVRILVEAAIPLTLFGLLQVFFNVLFYSPTISGVERPNRAFSAASSVFGALYASFAALSPQMIIFRITTGRSFVQNHEVHSSLGPASGPREQFSQPIIFNKPPPTVDTSLSFVETGSAVSRLENGGTHRGEVDIRTEKPF